MLNPSLVLNLVILCGILSIIFAYITGVQILSASSGNARMKEIAGAIQIGAREYLNRQYKTISIVGVVVLIAVIFLFKYKTGKKFGFKDGDRIKDGKIYHPLYSFEEGGIFYVDNKDIFEIFPSEDMEDFTLNYIFVKDI